jgi:hypothetical protein
MKRIILPIALVAVLIVGIVGNVLVATGDPKPPTSNELPPFPTATQWAASTPAPVDYATATYRDSEGNITTQAVVPYTPVYDLAVYVNYNFVFRGTVTQVQKIKVSRPDGEERWQIHDRSLVTVRIEAVYAGSALGLLAGDSIVLFCNDAALKDGLQGVFFTQTFTGRLLESVNGEWAYQKVYIEQAGLYLESSLACVLPYAEGWVQTPNIWAVDATPSLVPEGVSIVKPPDGSLKASSAVYFTADAFTTALGHYRTLFPAGSSALG